MPWLILSAVIVLLAWTFLPGDDVVQETDAIPDRRSLLGCAVTWLRRNLP